MEEVNTTPQEETAKKTGESSIITIDKDVYGMFTATWQKYGREIKVKAPTDVQAIKALVKEIDNIIDQENAKIMDDFTKDEKFQKAAIEQANQIHDLMKGKWFRLDELIGAVKNKISKQAALESLASLNAFGLLIAKQGINGTKYKILFTQEQRIAIRKEQQEYHQAEISKLSKEIEDLEKGSVEEVDDDNEQAPTNK